MVTEKRKLLEKELRNTETSEQTTQRMENFRTSVLDTYTRFKNEDSYKLGRAVNALQYYQEQVYNTVIRVRHADSILTKVETMETQEDYENVLDTMSTIPDNKNFEPSLLNKNVILGYLENQLSINSFNKLLSLLKDIK